MGDVDRLFEQYVERYRRGESGDPTEFFEQLDGVDRLELEALIDGFLRTSPGRDWDADAYSGSAVERFVERTELALSGSAGWWPQLLPRLRERAELTRKAVVERLADGLGVADKREKVGGYYHGMEHGTLPAAGVADRVLDVLGSILGESAEALRDAGSSLAPGITEGAAGSSTPLYARTALPDERYGVADLDAGADAELEALPSEPDVAQTEWDDVDELFRGSR